MYICICNAVTDHEIRQAVSDGVRTMAELVEKTGCSDECGSCACDAEAILQHELSQSGAHLRLVTA